MVRSRLGPIVVAIALISAPIGCGANVDLAATVKVVDVLTGYYDAGVIKDGSPQAGWSHILPSITFKLHNDSAAPISSVHLMVSFWAEARDGEGDSREIPGIGNQPLAPGASSEPITVRSSVGFNLEAPRTELFNQSGFVDWTAKLFAKRGGRIVPIGVFKIDRRLLPRERVSNRQ